MDRAREMYSTELDDEPIQPLLNALPADQATRKVKTALRRVQRSFTNLNQSLVEQQVEFINQTNPDEDFNTAIEKLSARLHQWLRKREPSPLVEQVLAYYFVCLRYLKLVELFNDHFRWRVLRVDQKKPVSDSFAWIPVRLSLKPCNKGADPFYSQQHSHRYRIIASS